MVCNLDSRTSLPPSLRMMHLWPEGDLQELAQRKAIQTTRPIDIWQPQEKQQELLRLCGFDEALTGGAVKPAVCRGIGYGGAAFGGKTEGLVALAMLACMAVPGVNVGYFRRTYPELEGSDGPIERSQQLYTRSGGEYNSQKHVWTFGNRHNVTSHVHFCHCQHERNVSNYQSAAFDILLIDEATTFSWYIVDHLIARNRPSKDSTLPHPFRVMTANPGGVGHSWYMQIFGLEGILYQHKGQALTPMERPNPNGKMETTVFLPAFLEDNQIGVAKDPEYEHELMRRDPALAEALRYGDWSVFSGQAFREWVKARHVCKAFEVPEHWPRWRGIDWGYDAPWAVYWFAKNPDSRRIYVTREIYRAGTTDPQQARLIREKSEPNADYSFNFADPSMWKRDSSRNEVTSTAEIYAQNGVLLTKADNDHRSKMAKLHAILRDLPDGLPGLQVFEGMCPNLVRTIPALMTDPENPEDLVDGQEDHAFDALTYGLTNWNDPFPEPGAKKKKVGRSKSGFEQLIGGR
jgi:phage terminase large subunit